MADGFIVRKGGVTTEQTATPSILDFSTASTTSIKFKLRNNDSVAATLVYRFNTLTGDGESISVAANTTTSEITFTVPTITTPTSLFVTANATGKVKSEVAEQEFAVPVIYTAATGGTTAEYDSGGKRFKSHTFLEDGDFVVSTVGDATDDRNKVDYLIVAGGGSGAAGGNTGGGGGAGGYKTTITPTPGDVTADSKFTVTATTFAVVVGAGGSAVTYPNQGKNGTSSSVFSVVPSGGGGGGGDNGDGQNGGSGGGGGGTSLNFTAPGGTGVSGQGRNGGDGIRNATSTLRQSGGGGGSGAEGQDATTTDGGDGGNGLANTLRDGTSETRAGGGGGGARNNGISGLGGTGGGGDGGDSSSENGQNGTVNTGSGGGGGGRNATVSGSGGKGIVIIRYEIATV